MNLRCKAYEFIIRETVPSDRNLGIRFPESRYHRKRNGGTASPEWRFIIARNTQFAFFELKCRVLEKPGKWLNTGKFSEQQIYAIIIFCLVLWKLMYSSEEMRKKCVKIALIMGNYIKQGFPPLGILYLAAYVRKYSPDTQVKVYDILPEKEKLLSEQFNLIGFSSLSIQYPDICEYASSLREKYKGILLIGGVHTTLTKDIPIWADVGIIGEGERTLLELVKELSRTGKRELSKIKGLIYREGGKKIVNERRELIDDLDEIPFPAWDLIDMTPYLKDNNTYGTVIGRGISLMSSRGCCYHCEFCAAAEIWGPIRFHSAEYLFEMISHVVEKYRVDYIWMADDHFAINKGRLRHLAGLLEKNNIHVGIGISCRVESYDEEMSILLHQIGVQALALGLETGSDRVLKRIKNGCQLSVYDEAILVQKMREDGFQVHGMFMLNTPDETMEDLQQTVEFIHKLPLNKISVAIALPYYGTNWWDYAYQQGIVNDDPNDFQQLRAYNMKMLSENRPIFRTGVPRKQLNEIYNELIEYGRSLFYFDWERRE